MAGPKVRNRKGSLSARPAFLLTPATRQGTFESQGFAVTPAATHYGGMLPQGLLQILSDAGVLIGTGQPPGTGGSPGALVVSAGSDAWSMTTGMG